MFKLPDVEMYYNYVINLMKKDQIKYKDFLKTYIENFSNFNAVSWSNLLKEFDLKLNLNANPFRNLKNEINPIKDLDSYLGIYKAIDQEEELFIKNIEYLKCLMQK